MLKVTIEVTNQDLVNTFECDGCACAFLTTEESQTYIHMLTPDGVLVAVNAIINALKSETGEEDTDE